MLDFGLAALEEVKGVGGFGVDVFNNGENIQDVLFCEGGLVAAVEVVLLYQDLEGQESSNKNTLGACMKMAEKSPELNLVRKKLVFKP